MMHARPIRSHKTKQLPNSFGLTGLAPVARHNLRLSLYITSRILFILNLLQSWLACLQKINPLAFGVFVSSMLTPFPFILAARGSSLRFGTRAFIAFNFFLYCVCTLASTSTSSCRSILHGTYTNSSTYYVYFLKIYNKYSIVRPYPSWTRNIIWIKIFQ